MCMNPESVNCDEPYMGQLKYIPFPDFWFPPPDFFSPPLLAITAIASEKLSSLKLPSYVWKRWIIIQIINFILHKDR